MAIKKRRPLSCYRLPGTWRCINRVYPSCILNIATFMTPQHTISRTLIPVMGKSFRRWEKIDIHQAGKGGIRKILLIHNKMNINKFKKLFSSLAISGLTGTAIVFTYSVFHRILDLKTGLDFYPGPFFILGMYCPKDHRSVATILLFVYRFSHLLYLPAIFVPDLKLPP